MPYPRWRRAAHGSGHLICGRTRRHHLFFMRYIVGMVASLVIERSACIASLQDRLEAATRAAARDPTDHPDDRPLGWVFFSWSRCHPRLLRLRAFSESHGTWLHILLVRFRCVHRLLLPAGVACRVASVQLRAQQERRQDRCIGRNYREHSRARTTCHRSPFSSQAFIGVSARAADRHAVPRRRCVRCQDRHRDRRIFVTRPKMIQWRDSWGLRFNALRPRLQARQSMDAGEGVRYLLSVGPAPRASRRPGRDQRRDAGERCRAATRDGRDDGVRDPDAAELHKLDHDARAGRSRGDRHARRSRAAGRGRCRGGRARGPQPYSKPCSGGALVPHPVARFTALPEYPLASIPAQAELTHAAWT